MVLESGRGDLNPRPPAPKAGALPLRHSPGRPVSVPARLRPAIESPGAGEVDVSAASGGAFQDVDAAGRAEPDHVGEPDARTFDLPVAGFAAQVVADLPDVRDTGRRDRVALRLEAARHVHRRRAVTPRRTRLEEVDRAAFFAEHQVVVVHELR